MTVQLGRPAFQVLALLLQTTALWIVTARLDKPVSLECVPLHLVAFQTATALLGRPVNLVPAPRQAALWIVTVRPDRLVNLEFAPLQMAAFWIVTVRLGRHAFPVLALLPQLSAP